MSFALLIGVVLVAEALIVFAVYYFTARRFKLVMATALHRRSALMEVASHELRTPLNTILGLIKSLRSTQSLDAPSIEEKLDKLSSSGSALNNTLIDILEIFDVTNRRLEISNQMVNLTELLEKVVEIVDHKEAKLVNKTTKEYWATTDPVRLRQCITVLLTQCITQTKNGKVEMRLTIETGSNGSDTLYFHCKDSSNGMPKKYAKYYFVPEKYEHNPFLRGQPRSVLSLNLAHRIVSLMGGSIKVKSAIRAGVQFRIALPVKVVSVKPLHSKASKTPDVEADFIEKTVTPISTAKVLDKSTAQQHGIADKISLAGATLLLVDDVDANLDVLEAFLDEYNPSKIILASSAHEAMSAVKQHRVDAIFMDIQMPEIDGLKATKMIRGVEGYARTPIVPVSASSRIVNEELCKAATMTGFVEKPIDEDRLRAVIEVVAKKLPRRALEKAA